MHKNSRRRKMKNDKIKKTEFFELQEEKAKTFVFKKAVKQATTTLGDVSINDCANLNVSRNRLKKSKRQVEEAKMKEEIKEEGSWDAADEADYDYVQEENEDGTITLVKKQIHHEPEEHVAASGKDYPFDIWLLISGYVLPEDVGRFAAICRTSYHVTSTANFWYSLYKRHFRNNPVLPLALTPKNIFRHYGVRTSVIRALFHLYPPFVNRLAAFQPHPDILCRSRCLVAWQKKRSGSWFYYFKLKETGNEERKKARDLVEALQDVKANSEEGCRLLRIVSRSFYPLPPIERLFLMSVDVRLSSTLTEQNVILMLASGLRYANGKIDGGGGTCLRLDQVTKINVFDWWDPRYPHSNNLKLLLN